MLFTLKKEEFAIPILLDEYLNRLPKLESIVISSALFTYLNLNAFPFESC